METRIKARQRSCHKITGCRFQDDARKEEGVMYLEKPKCRNCTHCSQIGRSEGIGGRWGRKHYYCKHEKVFEFLSKWSTGFVGYGDNSFLSPLALKTSPRWCPRKQLKDANVKA